MAIVTDPKCVESALEIIREAATLNPTKEKADNPETIVYRHSEMYSVNQGPYMKFMKAQGISPETLSQVVDNNRAWNSACAKFAGERMEEIAPKAIKDKEFVDASGMKKLQVLVKTTVKDGSTTLGVKAFSENPIPNTDPLQMSQKYGGITIRHKLSVSKSVDMETAEGIGVSIESLIRGKF